MPPSKRDGVTALYVEIPNELAAKLDALCSALPIGGKADHVRLALERHIAHPPSVVVPELPPVEASAKPGKKAAVKKSVKSNSKGQ